MGLQDRGRRRATPHPCPAKQLGLQAAKGQLADAKQLALRIRDQRDLLRASGGRNFDRLAGQNSPVWHTLFLFYLVVAKKSQKGKQPHAASYEALEAQVAEYMEACRQRFFDRERPTKYGIPTWMFRVLRTYHAKLSVGLKTRSGSTLILPKPAATDETWMPWLARWSAPSGGAASRKQRSAKVLVR